jgi:hypothetical protein
VRACLRFCVGLVTKVWLLTCPSTFSFCLFFVYFLIIFCIHLDISHPKVLHFSWCQCDHTIDDLGIHLLCCSCKNECTIVHDVFQDTIAAITLENGVHVKREVSHLFTHHTQRQVDYCHHQKQFSNLSKHCHYRFDSSKFGVTCFNDDNACNGNYCSSQNTILHKANARRWFHSPCHRNL